MLVAQLLIHSDEQIETRHLRGVKQRSVFQARPTLKPSRRNRVMSLDKQPQFLRHAFIKQNFHPTCKVSTGGWALFAAKSNTA